jgi:osmotically-inducible protein OsmY
MESAMKASPTIDDNDTAAFAAARKRLDESSTIPGTVRVHVVDGVVTLAGTVERSSQRADAERIIRPVIGARRLLNNITVIADTAAAESLSNSG